MKLLIASRARGAVGGVETYLRGLAPALCGRGHQLGVVFEHRYEREATHPDPYAGCAAEWCDEEQPRGQLLAAVRAWGPELVWNHGLDDSGLEAALLELAPALLYAHNYDGACATGEKFRRWPHPQPCARPMGWACAPINFSQHCGRLRPSSFAAGWRRQRQRAGQLGRYRRVMVASRHMEAEFARQGVARERLERLPYPRLGPAPPAERGGAAETPRRILMLARLTANKGGAHLLHACAAAGAELGRPLAVTIAGDGPERPRLQALARELKLGARFPGWVSAACAAAQYADADLLAVPSLWPEPFGMVGIEAGAYGVPAAGYAVGGIPDWLHSGVNGELAPGDPPTVAGLTAAMVRALGDGEHWRRLGQGARAVAGEYTLEAHLNRLEAVLTAALADGAGAGLAAPERSHGE